MVRSVATTGRLASVLLGLEGEAFVVDLRLGDPEPAQAVQDPSHHSGGAADETSRSLMSGTSRRRPWGRAGRRHLGRSPPTDQVVDRGAAETRQLVDLTLEDHVLRPAGAVDEGQVAARCRQFLEQRAQRGDADAAGDEQDPGLGPGAPVRAPYGPSTKTGVPTGIRCSVSCSRRAP